MEEILPIAEVVTIPELAQTFLGQCPLLQVGKNIDQLWGESERGPWANSTSREQLKIEISMGSTTTKLVSTRLAAKEKAAT
jgi:hypothetical protein